MTKANPQTVRVAAVQAEGCYFDLPAAIQKTCDLIIEAAGKGIEPIDFEMVSEYMKHSLQRDSAEMRTIQECAAANNISVCLGYSENDNDSLYLSQSFIGKDGKIKMYRRKIKPTHIERTIYSEGSGGSLMNVIDEPDVGRVGALSCWEHSQPLLRYHTYSQGEEFHVAAWPPMNYYSSFLEDSALWSRCRDGHSYKKKDFFTQKNCGSELVPQW
ncbi:hypothetical protein AbraIFM66950_009875 [Aspergillus brasiliensis]|nr:hypothetical protein AbraIFM66950_009875 [Aspergillus brasiliensis]